MFAKQDIDLKDPKEARRFLENHCTYYTLNPCNQLKSYANNVRITRLDLTKEQMDFAWELVCDERMDTFEYDVAQQDLIQQFCNENHCDVYFNGRSNGWLVIVPRDLEGKAVTRGFPAPWDISYEDGDEIIELARTIDAFDRLCDDLCDLIRYFADNATILTEEVTYTVTRRRVTIP